MAVKIPKYRLLRGHGILDAPFQYDTPFKGSYVYSTGLTLNENGKLTCAPGYTWDFGSGPAIDTPDMVYGSLAHDALYDMAQHHLKSTLTGSNSKTRIATGLLLS